MVVTRPRFSLQRLSAPGVGVLFELRLLPLDFSINIRILIRSLQKEVMLVPNKTIYIREADRDVWEKAEKLAGGSVSALLTEALRRYIETKEPEEGVGMETIEVELAYSHERYGWEEGAYPAQFVGRWLLYPDPDETGTSEPEYDAGAYYGVALTQRAQIAVYMRHVNDGFAPTLRVYSSFDEAEQEGVPAEVLARAASAAGADYVQKLDI